MSIRRLSGPGLYFRLAIGDEFIGLRKCRMLSAGVLGHKLQTSCALIEAKYITGNRIDRNISSNIWRIAERNTSGSSLHGRLYPHLVQLILHPLCGHSRSHRHVGRRPQDMANKHLASPSAASAGLCRHQPPRRQDSSHRSAGSGLGSPRQRQ